MLPLMAVAKPLVPASIAGHMVGVPTAAPIVTIERKTTKYVPLLQTCRAAAPTTVFGSRQPDSSGLQLMIK
jgi:hypothetical protein